MGKLIGDADQICGYGFSSTYLGNKADKVRNDIAKLEAYDWEKLENVETTFSGSMYLHEVTNKGKLKEAEAKINGMFIPILKDRKSGALDVIINCALMVEGLGKPITFDVVNKN